jgi:ABC-type multidrug transport system fused ATPase/permease subunit
MGTVPATSPTEDTPPEATSPEAAWRGIAAEDQDDVAGKLGAFLRRRSRRLLGDLIAPYRRLAVTIFLLIVAAQFAALAGPWLVGVGIDKIPALERTSNWGPMALIIVAFAVAVFVQAAASRSYIANIGRLGERVVLELRRRLFAHFQRLPISFHEHYTSGRVISRQVSDIDSISDLFDESLANLVSALLSLLLIGGGMLLLDWRMALVVMAGFPPLIWLSIWFRRESAVAYRRTRTTIAQVIVQFVETFGGIRAVQAFRRESRNQQIFSGLNQGYADANLRSSRLLAIFFPGVTLVGNLAIGVVLLYGGYRVIDHQMQVGVLVTFLLYLQRFFDPLIDLSQFYSSFQSAGAALEKISGVLEEAPAVAEPQDPVSLPAPAGGRSIGPGDRDDVADVLAGHAGEGRQVQFDSVRFGYRSSIVLPDLDLTIPAGQTVALVGATGAGKTTIARLLARMYDPGEGQVMLDGVDVRQLADRTLRHEVVLITQENFLFTGSIADNIELGKPGASRAEVLAAATAIGADSFISELPAGYDESVGKGGGRLSAGQRQLISFARAFLAAPAVLVLDEATSLLDIPSERLVQEALQTILAGRTALIIAHRLSTVAIADRVLVLEHGRIIEDGSPAELLDSDGEYSALHTSWQESLA